MVLSGAGAKRDAPSPGSTTLSHQETPETPRPEAQPAPAVSPFDRQHLLLTLGLVLTVAAVAFETLAVATILPAVVAELGGIHLYGWAFSAFLLAQLVAIVIALFGGRTPEQIRATDAEALFARLDLRSHLTTQRSNGLRALVDRIKSDAEAASAA